MAIAPDPIGIFHRFQERILTSPMRSVENPEAITDRHYGITRGLKSASPPLDFTLSHFGGTMHGGEVGTKAYIQPHPGESSRTIALTHWGSGSSNADVNTIAEEV